MGDESAASIDELRDDMGFVLGSTRALRDTQMDLGEQMHSLQRGFLTTRDADRKLWRRAADLEREVADLKRDRDAQSVVIGSLWREVRSLQDELRGLR